MEWLDEQAYISHVAWKRDLRKFNGDLECFKRYVEMQAGTAEREWHDEIAKSIRWILEHELSS